MRGTALTLVLILWWTSVASARGTRSSGVSLSLEFYERPDQTAWIVVRCAQHTLYPRIEDLRVCMPLSTAPQDDYTRCDEEFFHMRPSLIASMNAEVSQASVLYERVVELAPALVATMLETKDRSFYALIEATVQTANGTALFKAPRVLRSEFRPLHSPPSLAQETWDTIRELAHAAEDTATKGINSADKRLPLHMRIIAMLSGLCVACFIGVGVWFKRHQAASSVETEDLVAEESETIAVEAGFLSFPQYG